MRNKLTTFRLLASLVAPMMFGCGSEGSSGTDLVTVPQCDDANKVLSTDSTGQLICKDLPAGAAALPNCHKYSEALTSDGSKTLCTARNNESATSTMALNNLESSEKLINDYTTRLGKLTPGPGARSTYCGQTAGTNGAITSGNLTGIAAAAALCSQVQACGSTGHMCTVYDMYYSAATGVINSNMTISKSWVYMAAWQNSATAVKEPTAGLADNCGSYTYPTADKAWDGTAVRWEPTDTGKYGLKFYTGNGPNDTSATQGAQCNYTFPIACCK